MYERMGVIGNKDSVSAFKAIGVEVFDATNAEEARHLVRELMKQDFAVVFIAENLAEQISETIARAKEQAFPAIVPIPLSGEGTGYGMKGIKKDVEKAIGMDILFNRED